MKKKLVYFFSFLILYAFNVNAKTLEQDLNVEIGVFNAAKVKMTYAIDNSSYAFSSKVQTAGLFSKLYHFDAVYSTKGLIKDKKFITQNYQYISKSSSHTRTKELVFDKLGTLIERKSSKDNKAKTVKVNLNNHQFDFNDLQSVFAYLVKQVKENKFCDIEKQVFDGKKSYHISVKDEGIDYLDDQKTLKCSLFIKRTDNKDDDLLFDTTAERPIYFWIGNEQKTLLPYVIKIEIDSTPLGRLKAYTTDVNIKE